MPSSRDTGLSHSRRQRTASLGDDAALETAASDRSASESTPPGITSDSVLAGRYRIERFLAQGGMGEVYRAYDLELGIPVALKTIRSEIASDPGALRGLKQEVLIARSISHPNVCRIYDLGKDEASGISFLTMEYLAGETLKARIRRLGPMTPEIALPIVRQLTAALDAAHQAGVVHRDLKSANAMLVPGEMGERAVIMDFGLAGAAEEKPLRGAQVTEAQAELDETIASPQGFVGTPAYASPEQVMGDPVGPASDRYTLGILLFELVTGRLPFTGTSPRAVGQARLTQPPPAPSSFASVDPVWDRTILKLLAKDPEDRYASGKEVILALEGRYTGAKRAKHSLPAELAAFVGRQLELAQLASLESELPHLQTLLGPGGTGKTRLAQRYGWESLPRWPGGVWFCDLSEAHTADGIASAIARSLDVPLGKDDPVTQLGHAIAGRGRALLILDNFEQVAEHAPATVGEWLEHCPEASFLVTSRERLGLDGESVLVLEPLDPLSHGVELFELRARATRPGFSVDDGCRDLVAEIVTKLEGLPLAIELAAARLRMLSLQQLRDRLESRFEILTGGRQGRHSTLEATLDWSWELLAQWEQAAVAQAAVFRGGFTLEAAEAVLDLSAYPQAPPVLDTIQSLVDKSWLRTPVIAHHPRFDMYVTVQQYAVEKLRDDGTSLPGGHAPEWIAERHGQYFAGLGTEEAIAALDRHGGMARRAELALELENLIAACRWAKAGKDDAIAAATYLAAAEVLVQCGPLRRSISLGSEVLSGLHAPSLRGRVATRLGDTARLGGMPVEAKAHLEEALALARGASNRRLEGVVLGSLSILYREQGRMEEARALYEQALATQRAIGDRLAEGTTLAGLGTLNLEQGRMAEARTQLEQALAIDRDLGNRPAEGSALSNLGILNREQGRMEEARSLYEQALAIHRKGGHRRPEGVVLGNLGALYHEMGKLEEAQAHFEQALTIHREVGNRRSEGIVLANLGNLTCDHGLSDAARSYFQQALAIARELGNRRLEANVLGNLGTLDHEQGRLEAARADFEQALALLRAAGDQRHLGFVLGNLGVLYQEMGELERAEPCINEGIAILRQVNQPLELAKALCHRAEFEHHRHRNEASRAALSEAEAIAHNLAVEPDAELARTIAKLHKALGDMV